jgi:Domain of unknown function (DUF929)
LTSVDDEPPDRPSESGQDEPRGRSARARDAQRQRAIVILSAVVTVAVLVVAVVAIALHGSGGSSTPIVTGSPPVAAGSPTDPASPSPPATSDPATPDVLAALTGVSPAVEAQVGSGVSYVAMKSVTGPAPAAGSTPTVLFVGAEFCPFCAAERWSIIQALSRFGTFSGLAEIRSSEGDLATFDFATATYTSQYVGFDPIELEGQDRQQIGTISAMQLKIFKKYSVQESFPFLYLDGHYSQAGAGFDPGVLSGLDQRQIATALSDPAAATTRAIVGEANVLTAAICDTTNDAPATACANSAVTALQSRLSGAVSS